MAGVGGKLTIASPGFWSSPKSSPKSSSKSSSKSEFLHSLEMGTIPKCVSLAPGLTLEDKCEVFQKVFEKPNIELLRAFLPEEERKQLAWIIANSKPESYQRLEDFHSNQAKALCLLLATLDSLDSDGAAGILHGLVRIGNGEAIRRIFLEPSVFTDLMSKKDVLDVILASQDNDGQTLFCTATQLGHWSLALDLLYLLIDVKGNPFIANEKGQSALSFLQGACDKAGIDDFEPALSEILKSHESMDLEYKTDRAYEVLRQALNGLIKSEKKPPLKPLGVVLGKPVEYVMVDEDYFLKSPEPPRKPPKELPPRSSSSHDSDKTPSTPVPKPSVPRSRKGPSTPLDLDDPAPASSPLGFVTPRKARTLPALLEILQGVGIGIFKTYGCNSRCIDIFSIDKKRLSHTNIWEVFFQLPFYTPKPLNPNGDNIFHIFEKAINDEPDLLKKAQLRESLEQFKEAFKAQIESLSPDPVDLEAEFLNKRDHRYVNNDGKPPSALHTAPQSDETFVSLLLVKEASIAECMNYIRSLTPDQKPVLLPYVNKRGNLAFLEAFLGEDISAFNPIDIKNAFLFVVSAIPDPGQEDVQTDLIKTLAPVAVATLPPEEACMVLSRVAQGGNEAAMRHLLSLPFFDRMKDAPSPQGFTPFLAAVMHQQWGVASALFDATVDINAGSPIWYILQSWNCISWDHLKVPQLQDLGSKLDRLRALQGLHHPNLDMVGMIHGYQGITLIGDEPHRLLAYIRDKNLEGKSPEGFCRQALEGLKVGKKVDMLPLPADLLPPDTKSDSEPPKTPTKGTGVETLASLFPTTPTPASPRPVYKTLSPKLEQSMKTVLRGVVGVHVIISEDPLGVMGAGGPKVTGAPPATPPKSGPKSGAPAAPPSGGATPPGGPPTPPGSAATAPAPDPKRPKSTVAAGIDLFSKGPSSPASPPAPVALPSMSHSNTIRTSRFETSLRQHVQDLGAPALRKFGCTEDIITDIFAPLASGITSHLTPIFFNSTTHLPIIGANGETILHMFAKMIVDLRVSNPKKAVEIEKSFNELTHHLQDYYAGHGFCYEHGSTIGKVGALISVSYIKDNLQNRVGETVAGILNPKTTPDAQFRKALSDPGATLHRKSLWAGKVHNPADFFAAVIKEGFDVLEALLLSVKAVMPGVSDDMLREALLVIAYAAPADKAAQDAFFDRQTVLIDKILTLYPNLSLEYPRGEQNVLDGLSQNGNLQAVNYVLDFLKDRPEEFLVLNLQNAQGRTPVFTAAANCHPDIVAALLKAGVDKGIVDGVGRTPFQFVLGSQNYVQWADLQAEFPAFSDKIAQMMRFHATCEDVASTEDITHLWAKQPDKAGHIVQGINEPYTPLQQVEQFQLISHIKHKKNETGNTFGLLKDYETYVKLRDLLGRELVPTTLTFTPPPPTTRRPPMPPPLPPRPKPDLGPVPPAPKVKPPIAPRPAPKLKPPLPSRPIPALGPPLPSATTTGFIPVPIPKTAGVVPKPSGYKAVLIPSPAPAPILSSPTAAPKPKHPYLMKKSQPLLGKAPNLDQKSRIGHTPVVKHTTGTSTTGGILSPKAPPGDQPPASIFFYVLFRAGLQDILNSVKSGMCTRDHVGKVLTEISHRFNQQYPGRLPHNFVKKVMVDTLFPNDATIMVGYDSITEAINKVLQSDQESLQKIRDIYVQLSSPSGH
jgi:hypothetical protein